MSNPTKTRQALQILTAAIATLTFGQASSSMAEAQASPSAASAPQPHPTFSCEALPYQQCHYVVLHVDGRHTEFALRRGEVRQPDSVNIGDRYMMSIDGPPPTDFRTCAMGRFNARRSAWCKTGVIRTSHVE